MGKFAVQVPTNLSRYLFGIWLIGMGAVGGIDPRSPTLLTLLGVMLGGILIGAGVLTILGR